MCCVELRFSLTIFFLIRLVDNNLILFLFFIFRMRRWTLIIKYGGIYTYRNAQSLKGLDNFDRGVRYGYNHSDIGDINNPVIQNFKRERLTEITHSICRGYPMVK